MPDPPVAGEVPIRSGRFDRSTVSQVEKSSTLLPAPRDDVLWVVWLAAIAVRDDCEQRVS